MCEERYIPGYHLRYFTTKVSLGSSGNGSFVQKVSSLHLLRTVLCPTMKRSASSLPYHVHKVSVSQESIKTPGQIIDFEISVIDTHPDDNEKPTVVGIHGIPGSAVDFEPCIQKLLESNVRFIGPTFPGFETSEVESWKLYHLKYTSTDCASLVQQVLHHLRINRPSMIMCHSAGGWTGYNLAAQSGKVKSLCLLNPVGGRPHRAMRPVFMIHFLAWLTRIRSLHFLLMPLMEYAYSLTGFTGVKGGDHLMVAQQLLSNQNFDIIKKQAKQIQEKQVPLLFAYTLNDKLIEVPVYEEMLFRHLNVPQSAVTTVDTEKKLLPLLGTPVDEVPRARWFAHGLQFERGGHVVHKAYSQIIMDRVLQLLHHVEDDNSVCSRRM